MKCESFFDAALIHQSGAIYKFFCIILQIKSAEMPVGCLGGLGNGSNGQNGGHYGQNGHQMDIIVTSSVLNAADQFAFMQQTLLMQIFRVNPPENRNTENRNPENCCPTCIAFSDRCCQEDPGKNLFDDFIEANLHYGVWFLNSSDALNSLR